MPFLTQGKTNWKYILIIVILAIIVDGGVLGWQWLEFKKEIKISELKLPEKVKYETAYRKTYRNEEHGFEIKYPKDWEVATNVNLREKFGITEENAIGINLNKVNCDFNIQELTKESYENRENLASTCEKQETVTINGVSVERFSCLISQMDYRYRYYFEKDGKYYFIEFLDNKVSIANKALEEGKEIPVFIDNCWGYFDQMLYTFRFIEEETAKEQACINFGGTVTTASCCKSMGDFPNSCLIGACGCSPDNSHQVKTCDCGENKCFDGTQCIQSIY